MPVGGGGVVGAEERGELAEIGGGSGCQGCGEGC